MAHQTGGGNAAHVAVLFNQQNLGAQFRSGIGSAEAGRAAAQNKYIGILRIFLNHDNLQKGNCASSLAAARRIVILKYCTLVPGLLTRYNEKIYVQVAYVLSDDNVIAREFGVYKNIEDNYPKYVISTDTFDMSQNGIIHKNIIDWLLER